MNAWVAQRADKALQEARAGNPKALDRLMRVALPFNRPHRIGIIEVNEELSKCRCPSAVPTGITWGACTRVPLQRRWSFPLELRY